jgi:surface antigen
MVLRNGSRSSVVRRVFPAGLAILAASLCGCATHSTSKSGADAAVTAYAGSRTGNELLDAMAGGLVGGQVGAGLDTRERRTALQAEYRALEYTPSGQKVAWQGDRDGHHGEVSAGQPYQVGSQNCRQYSQTVFVGTAPRTARGTACRNPDGSWTPLT